MGRNVKTYVSFVMVGDNVDSFISEQVRGVGVRLVDDRFHIVVQVVSTKAGMTSNMCVVIPSTVQESYLSYLCVIRL